MTRLNSVEIGGRDSRTTSSIAWRNEEPARSAFAMSVIVSGSCLLNWLSRDARRQAEDIGRRVGGEHRVEELRRREEDEAREGKRQERHDVPRQPLLGGERPDLALDPDPLTDRVGD
jgi:hypothetical protein